MFNQAICSDHEVKPEDGDLTFHEAGEPTAQAHRTQQFPLIDGQPAGDS